jgi:Ser/Thr protein kinase RdoA (MazF antagonist)
MMANITRITEHIRTKVTRTDAQLARRQLKVIETNEGTGYHRDPGGNFWRVYNFIEDALTYDTLQSPARASEAARMFGWFQRLLLDLPGPPLHDTIPDFHNTHRRLEAFRDVLKADAHNRARHAQGEIDFLLERTRMSDVLPRLVAGGQIPVGIAHNDAKINNVMLDRRTHRGVCVIDLDTVMPGLSLYDFGDLVRTAACAAAEDERDLSKVAIDLSLFEALARGFAAETAGFLTPAEREHLVFAGKLITYEQFVRFLTDYLAGDAYYKVSRDRHNLDRSRTQMKLVQSIVEHEEAMDAVVARTFQDLADGAR